MCTHGKRSMWSCNIRPLTISGEQVFPKPSAKILGVVLDQQLRFKEYVARAAKRGLWAVLALKRLRAFNIENRRFNSPFQRYTQRFEAIDLSHIETIEPYCTAPWAASMPTHIVNDCDEAVTKAEKDMAGGSLLHRWVSAEQLDGNRGRL